MSTTKIEKIDSTVGAWESGQLGRDEKFVKAVSLNQKALDGAVGLKPISIRMRGQLISDLKVIAEHNGLGYQTLIKQILERFAQAELREMAKEYVKSEKRFEPSSEDDDDKSAVAY